MMFYHLYTLFLFIPLIFASNHLPSNLIIGYPTWVECDQKVIKATEDGVNVIIWFSINLLTNETTGLPQISGGPNTTCIAQTALFLRENNLPTIHLISIGGWNSPHPDTRNSAQNYYNFFLQWNKNLVNSIDPSLDFHGFDDFISIQFYEG